MKKAKSALQSRRRLDERLEEFTQIRHPDPPARGWIKAIRESLGMTSAQLAKRLGIKQPSVVALEQSEVRGTIELATLRRAAEALDCRLVYALVPRTTLDQAVREKARVFARRRRAAVEHSMLLENQKVEDRDFDARLDETLRETNPKLFWD
jgi:predicted DNA-binding mobile mystery protein A